MGLKFTGFSGDFLFCGELIFQGGGGGGGVWISKKEKPSSGIGKDQYSKCLGPFYLTLIVKFQKNNMVNTVK